MNIFKRLFHRHTWETRYKSKGGVTIMKPVDVCTLCGKERVRKPWTR